eukprot:154422-Amphidinium_carterae.1
MQSSALWTCAGGESFHEGMALIHGCSNQNVLGGNLVHWKSAKQTLVTKSSWEAELLALVNGVETSGGIGPLQRR